MNCIVKYCTNKYGEGSGYFLQVSQTSYDKDNDDNKNDPMAIIGREASAVVTVFMCKSCFETALTGKTNEGYSQVYRNIANSILHHKEQKS